ncbi:MAG: 1-deoxy-D-xylulose-5-phosphate reductoisomerase [Oscillospiraceae bacterium]|nr:1-deoxy-D-xylulose-5-phosphate reductoisomerase [Oscillospiraceae bacterium]
MTETISILGSTGSIGRQTLDVADKLGLRVAALAAGSNVAMLEEQARRYMPRLAVLYDESAAKTLRQRLSDTDIKVSSGIAGLIEAAELEEADTVLTAVVGIIGLRPTLAAIAKRKKIALANKETLVCAGELVMAAAKKCGAQIVPVDSEHSAIFQCLQACANKDEIRRIILTCSGGPFFGMSYGELSKMTRADALKHPTWTMGAKITVDSATLMNKGLEFIEAMRLYSLPPEKVEIVIHRESIVHSLVEYRDGAYLAQLGAPDMRLPIQYAMTWPERLESPARDMDIFSIPALTFQRPDTEAFRALTVALSAAKTGGTACAVLNGANEEAVKLFLDGRIGFNDIADISDAALQKVPVIHDPCLEEILKADRLAREVASEEFSKI